MWPCGSKRLLDGVREACHKPVATKEFRWSINAAANSVLDQASSDEPIDDRIAVMVCGAVTVTVLQHD